MSAYVAGKDLLTESGEYAGVIPADDLAELSEKTLDNLLMSGKEMIDAYCHKSFGENGEAVPYTVKLVNVQLVTVMLTDPSKAGESIDDYSYNNNLSAFSQILSRLDILDIDGATISGMKKSIRARVI